MIEVYVKDVQNALKNKNYYCALSLALTLPDICGMAEFPDKSVGERYISFYDEYIRNFDTTYKNPYLSGEVVYNLRNTFLHQGSPNINSCKIKEEINQVDKFVLLLNNKNTNVYEFSATLNFPNFAVKFIAVDIIYLCEILCNGSLLYYKNNKSKFCFNSNIISIDDENNNILEDVIAAKFSAIKQQFQIFFEQNFSENKFKNKKKEIIAAILESQTKTQLNKKLTKLFLGEDVKIIFKRLRPLIKNLPGK